MLSNIAMIFSSFEFLVFFPVVTLLYFLLAPKSRVFLLLLAGCVFYSFFIPAYLLILIFLITVDYWVGKVIERTEGRRRLHFLWLSIFANGGVLFFFKYFNFFNENLGGLVHLLGFSLTIPHLEILLPLGLSFHVFQSLSYTIEVYRKNVPAEQNFFIYALYVMFYPQLVAGPIERPGHLLPQLHKTYVFDYVHVVRGLQLMAWGFFKKMIIADRIGIIVDQVYGNATLYSGPMLVLATVLFAYQLYCDFSGYSDIARGAARVMGYDLTINFNRPYDATTIGDFWRRWHISFSSWLRDYIYTPLKTRWHTWGVWGMVVAALITFFFSGLWHGAKWTFVIFGAVHGIALSIEFLTHHLRERLSARIPLWVTGIIGRCYVFLFWSFSLIFFRAQSVTQAWYILVHLHTDFLDFVAHIFDRVALKKYLLAGEYRNEYIILICSILLLEVVQSVGERYSIPEWFESQRLVLRWLVYSVAFWVFLVYGIFISRQFIYFAF